MGISPAGPPQGWSLSRKSKEAKNVGNCKVLRRRHSHKELNEEKWMVCLLNGSKKKTEI